MAGSRRQGGKTGSGKVARQRVACPKPSAVLDMSRPRLGHAAAASRPHGRNSAARLRPHGSQIAARSRPCHVMSRHVTDVALRG
jgi:hypothetical protein